MCAAAGQTFTGESRWPCRTHDGVRHDETLDQYAESVSGKRVDTTRQTAGRSRSAIQRGYDALTAWISDAEPWTRFPVLAVASMAVIVGFFAIMLSPFAFFAGEVLEGLAALAAGILVTAVAGPAVLAVVGAIRRSLD